MVTWVGYLPADASSIQIIQVSRISTYEVWGIIFITGTSEKEDYK
jgi:hypothetical protein